MGILFSGIFPDKKKPHPKVRFFKLEAWQCPTFA